MSIFLYTNMLCRCVMIEGGNIVKGDQEAPIVLYGTDICDLPGLKKGYAEGLPLHLNKLCMFAWKDW